MKVITTKYLPATNHKGSRIVASDGDGNRKIVNLDSSLSSDRNHTRAAILLCQKMGWDGTLQSGTVLKNGREVMNVHVWEHEHNQTIIAKQKTFA